MSSDFNPYYFFLGILPSEQPADYYRLLGLERFESNSDLIEMAADRQMSNLQRHEAGQYIDQVTALMNEVSRARLCLLDTRKKADYDRQLQPPLALSVAESATPEASPVIVQHIPEAIQQSPPLLPKPAPAASQSVDEGRIVGATAVPQAELPAQRNPPATQAAPRSSQPDDTEPSRPTTAVQGIVDASGKHRPRMPSNPWAPLLLVDRSLAKLAGEGNGLLHWGMRVLGAALFVLLTIGGLAWALSRPSQSPHADDVKAARELDAESVTAKQPQAENVPLEFAVIQDPTVEVDTLLTVQLALTQPGYWGGKAQFRLAGSVPSGAMIDPSSGQFSWQPTKVGSFSIQVEVASIDGRFRDSATFDIEVTPVTALANALTNTIGMKLSVIPAGEFMMGSPDSEQGRGSRETQHRVRITQPFYLGAYKVTQLEYQRVMASNPSAFKSVSGQDTSRFPVENVSWYDAVEFCNKLSVLEGKPAYYTLGNVRRQGTSIQSATVTIASGTGYRLPTEAEWEYACRAGTTTPFHFGSQLNGREANCNGNSPYGTTTKGPYLGRTTTVGSYAANDFGLYDMHGNVWEWCEDWYDGKFYDTAAATAANPVNENGGSFRVLRGGRWVGTPQYCRSADRWGWNSPGYRLNSLGFRVARSSVSP